MNTPPRFTEDEIAQMNREHNQILHDENIRLAEQLQAWQALGRYLVEALQVSRYEDDKFAFVHVRKNADWFTFYQDKHPHQYDVLTQLLELVSATSQPD